MRTPEVIIICPYCGKTTFMQPPNIDDWDHLMDEDCNECGKRIFAQFGFVPKLVGVYTLNLVPDWMEKLSQEFPNAI